MPSLTAWLRAHGHAVTPVDANLEAYEHLLRPGPLAAFQRKVEQRLGRLTRKGALTHAEQMLFAALWPVAAEPGPPPAAEIEAALGVLRDRSGERFYDPTAYEQAVAVVERALRLIGAAHAPLTLDFHRYRTPFALLDLEEMRRDARAERDPFHGYFAQLAGRLKARGIAFAGLSVAFPSQIQPAYGLGWRLKAYMPRLYLTVGGPAISQVLCRLEPAAAARALGPFDSAVLFEGEAALLELVGAVAGGERPRGVVTGRRLPDLAGLPPPDFDDLPLPHYFSPEPVLPYDASRGCYWNRCAFCHYGLSAAGTAPYRERPPATVLAHLRRLAARHGCRLFYLSQDTLAPASARRLAGGLSAAGAGLRWATDMRPERALTAACCRELAAGGALAMALGVESGCERVLRLIDKGVAPADARRAIQNLAAAGIAVEAMCMTGLPFESPREALETTAFLQDLRDRLALFVCGRFELVAGARMAQAPGAYGIAEIWRAAGDEFFGTLFHRRARQLGTQQEWERVEEAIAGLSRHFWLHAYPWAGAVSTAHSLLYYARHGPEAFRRLRPRPPRRPRGAPAPVSLPAGWDPGKIIAAAQSREAEIWDTLVHRERAVSRAAYHRLAARGPRLRTPPSRPGSGRPARGRGGRARR